MSLTKALIDTNVCLDALLARKPFFIHALKLMEYSKMGAFEGIVAAHSFDNIFYLLKKNNGKEKTYMGIELIREAYEVAPVTQTIIDDAIDAGWNDFEDAIHYQVARAAGYEAIVSRNTKDFEQSELPVLSPQRFLDQLTDKNEAE